MEIFFWYFVTGWLGWSEPPCFIKSKAVIGSSEVDSVPCL